MKEKVYRISYLQYRKTYNPKWHGYSLKCSFSVYYLDTLVNYLDLRHHLQEFWVNTFAWLFQTATFVYANRPYVVLDTLNHHIRCSEIFKWWIWWRKGLNCSFHFSCKIQTFSLYKQRLHMQLVMTHCNVFQNVCHDVYEKVTNSLHSIALKTKMSEKPYNAPVWAGRVHLQHASTRAL